jgi:hypothetical protein
MYEFVRIGASPEWMLFVATCGGKRLLRGVDRLLTDFNTDI